MHSRASISQDYWGGIKEVGFRGEAPVEGLGDKVPQRGSGGAPVEGLGDEFSQKLKLFVKLHIGLRLIVALKYTVADLTGGHTCSGRRGPCPKRPRRPHGRCAQEAHEMSRYIHKTKPALQSTVSAVGCSLH